MLAQKGIELELIVVGDGAPEDVESRLKAFKDKRIRYITLPKGGLTKALIAGCEAALNQYIARLDVGDFYAQRSGRQASRSAFKAADCWLGFFKFCDVHGRRLLSL